MLNFAPMTSKEMTYEEAVMYCFFLEHGGHRDWRLPTLDEYSTNLGLSGWYINRHISRFSYNTNWKVCPVRTA